MCMMNTGNQDQVHIGQLSTDVTGAFTGTGVTSSVRDYVNSRHSFPPGLS